MKVLFVCSGNSKNFEVSPFIKSQGDSLEDNGVNLDYYLIKGKGLNGYLQNVRPLRKKITSGDYDVVHSHYSLSGWVSELTLTRIPKVVSYMGSDTYGNIGKDGRLKPSGIINIAAAKTLQFPVETVIVKSENLKQYVNMDSKVEVVPNGVNIDVFSPISKRQAREKLELSVNDKYILFMGNKKDVRKNFALLDQASKILRQTHEIIAPYPIPHDEVPIYLNAADVLALTSFNEGSPNVIKEAMACNISIVSTNVGDVEWVIGDTSGCYIAEFDPADYAEKLDKALQFNGMTNGRERIKELGLDTESVAERLIEIYRNVIYS